MAADGVEDPMSVANAIGDCVLTDRIKKEQFQVKTLWKDQVSSPPSPSPLPPSAPTLPLTDK